MFSIFFSINDIVKSISSNNLHTSFCDADQAKFSHLSILKVTS